jgi:hypothetical protein
MQGRLEKIKSYPLGKVENAHFNRGENDLLNEEEKTQEQINYRLKSNKHIQEQIIN